MPPDFHPHRPLLPRPGEATPHGSDAADGDVEQSVARKRRRQYTSKACNSCRLKKIACDGQTVCSQCLRRRLKCEYRAVTEIVLKAIPPGSQLVDKEEALRNADAADLLEILKRVPDGEALEALQLLRSGNGAGEVSSALRQHDLGLSQVALNKAILPPTQSSLEFELMMTHPIAYPTWAPVQPSKLNLEFLLLPSKIHWNGTVTTVTVDSPHHCSSFPAYGQQREDTTLDGLGRIGAPETLGLYDNRLLGVDITQWTNVPITNDFSIAVLQLYLETDHPMIPLFDVDVFLDGLLGNNEFCSRFLVNALFAWACQGYAAFEPEAAIVGHAFHEEAKRMWREIKEDRKADHVCTVAALQYLSLTAVSLGAGAEYVEFLTKLREMGKRLGLINVAPSQALEDNVNDNTISQRAKAQAAWAIFNNLTLLSMRLHKRLIEHPPRFPIPDTSVHLTGETGKSKESKRRIYSTDLLRENSHLFLIVHDMVQVMYGPSQALYAGAITLEFAEETYRRLLLWADRLPLGMAQGDQCTNHALVTHIFYHLAILDLFRPFRQQNGAPRQRLRTFRSAESTPDSIHAASVNQLKRIVLYYRQTYLESSYSFFWHLALLYLANAMLREASLSGQNPEWRFYFRLCLACYQTLYTSYRLAKGITLSLLYMALEKGVIDVRLADEVRRDLELRGKHHEVADQVPISASFVLNLDLAVTGPSAGRAEELVQKFGKVQLGERDGVDGPPAQD